MKTHLIPTFFFAALVIPRLWAEDPVASTIKFSQPDQPQTVRIYIAQGDLKIVATDSKDTVMVKSEAEAEKKEVERPDGLRVIGSTASFSLTENNNVVELNYGRGSFLTTGADFIIEVPRNASIEVANGLGAEINVDGVMGDIDIKNMNGDITLKNIGGAALVETMNGEIHASFTSLPTSKALSFTSMNGGVRVNLPVDAKANVRFRTQNGSILTDFPEASMQIKSDPNSSPTATGETARLAGQAARDAARIAREVAHEVHQAIREAGADRHDSNAPRPPRPPRPPTIPSMVGGKVVSGTLNGGGLDLQIATMNGDIVVRKNAGKP